MRIDARIAVRLAEPSALTELPADPDLLLVLEEGADVPGRSAASWSAIRQLPALQTAESGAHPAACACCQGGSALGRFFAGLFQDRARGRLPPFREVLVLVSPRHAEAVRQTLRQDVLASAYYRLA